MARQSELVKVQAAGQSDNMHLGEVHRTKGKSNPARRPGRNVRDKNPKNTPFVQPCSRCNRVHKQDETCSARGKRCSKCRKIGHFAAVCRSVSEVTSDMGGNTEQFFLGGGRHWGYPIPHYRKKNWQIPKYRVKNRRNTDTAFMIGHVYLKLYPSRVFVYLKHVCTRNQPL